MLTIKITVAVILLFIQTSRCSTLSDALFGLFNADQVKCVNSHATNGPLMASCASISKFLSFRWVSGGRLFSPLWTKCIGVQGQNEGSGLCWYDCDEKSDLQQWECKNQTLLALKGQHLYMHINDNAELVLSKDMGPRSRFTVTGTTDGPCSRTHREIFTIDGNAYGQPCQFPFFYKGRWYGDCTTFDSPVNREWCATETKYENELWGHCPSTSTENWDKNPVTKVFYQFNYHSALTWHQARTSCQQQGSDLLSITEPQEQSYIAGILGKEHFQLWIGLNILDQESGWQWSDGKPFRYLRWDSGHPLPDPGQNCGVLNSAVQSYWQSFSCSKKLGYICQKGKPAPPAHPVEPGFCTSPWIPYAGQCYHLRRAKKTWSDAMSECRSEGSDLASIHNIEEQSFVISQLGYASTDKLWIGLNDQKTPLLFEWSDHSSVTYSRWEVGMPIHTNRQREDCVLIRGEEGKWASQMCENKFGFVCKKKSASKPSGDQVETNPGCKPGWNRHGSYCYLLGSETKTWIEAKDTCHSSGSYLADVSSGVDNAFLISLVGTRPEKYFWIGLFNQDDIDNFVWTNTKRVKFVHWNAEMPGNRLGCVAMTTGILAGLWDVLSCTNTEKYVCKYLAEGAVVTPAPITPAPPSCHEGWSPVGIRNYCFKFFTVPRSGKKTWFEARDYCRGIGGDLLSIHTAADSAYIRRGAGWIGLSAPDPNTGYVWSDGSPLSYQHWMDGEPNNHNNAEYCVEMTMYYWQRGESWNDAACESYNDWVCQIRKGKTPNPPPNGTIPDFNVTKDGWIEYGGNQYYFNQEDLAMDDARHYCQQKHGDLVVINGELENQFLWKQISRSYGHFYIGLTVDLDRSFGWMDGSPVVFEKWDQNQPDFINNDENCVVMGHKMGFWHDYNCGTGHKSICKRSGLPPANSTVAPTVPPKGGCPPDWVSCESKCYRLIESHQGTWSEARSQCIQMRGNLASVTSRRVQTFLTTKMVDGVTTDLWIGLTTSKRDQFLWTDGRPMRYINWAPNQPQKDQCVVMDSSLSSVMGKWKSRSCNDSNGYICQRNVDPLIRVTAPTVFPNAYIKLGNNSFKVVTQNMTWKDAMVQCEKDGAHLASILDQWTEAYIELQALNLKTPLWIGLNKMETEGYFRWIDGWHLTLAKWNVAEPSRDRPCVYLDPVRGGWSTDFCNRTFNSVCKQSTALPPTPPAQYPGECPKDVEDEQYNKPAYWAPFRGHCYAFMTHHIQWADASTRCVRKGASLASIEDPMELAFIMRNLEMLKDSHESFWIGLYKTHQGQWLWLDNTVLDYTNWTEGQPTERNMYNYAKIRSSDGTWGTGNRYEGRAYICKMPKVIGQNPLPTHEPQEAHQRIHSGMAVVVVLAITSVIGLTAFLLYKRSHQMLPTFDNPLYFNTERPPPDVVDINKLVENMEYIEPIITLK